MLLFADDKLTIAQVSIENARKTIEISEALFHCDFVRRSHVHPGFDDAFE